jgi:sugar/nucleoside kinase (ribokinase family)
MSDSVVVFGDLNLDTSVNIYHFPLHVGDTLFSFNGIADLIGGAATNVAVGLRQLGSAVTFGAVIGQDAIGDLVLAYVAEKQLDTRWIRRDWNTTSRTVVLIDPQGNRQCVNDPKQVHEYRYPETELPEMLARSSLVYCSTQSWCRYLAAFARSSGKTVAVDVQAIVDVDDYHRDFLVAADIVLLSTERLAMHSHDFIRKLWSDFDVSVVVATHGEHGATLGVRDGQSIVYQPAFHLGPVIDKTGAGDAFCAGFLAAVAAGLPFDQALTRAQLTAAAKIRHKGSTNGVPTRAELDALAARHTQPA